MSEREIFVRLRSFYLPALYLTTLSRCSENLAANGLQMKQSLSTQSPEGTKSGVILGIDPGSLRTGFGIVHVCGRRIVHVAHGTIMLDKQKQITERLGDLAHDMAALLQKYKPERAAVEDVFFAKHAHASLILGQARGAILAMLGLYHIKVQALSPTAIKSITAGHGRAQKFQVASMVALELNIPIPTHEDASDALAIALAEARRGLYGA